MKEIEMISDHLKVPQKGETVLLFDESGSDEEAANYRARVRVAGGRVRRAEDLESLARHLKVYTPTFIVHLTHRYDS